MSRTIRKILFAGGGTGGHIYPALATIEALQALADWQVLYVGGYRGMENQLVPEAGLDFRKIVVSGFQRYFTLRNLLFPFKLAISLVQSWKLLKKFRPAAVVGTGGYVSGPVVYMAAKMKIPTLIEEQDSFPGVTTRMLARYADVVCLPNADAAGHLRNVKGELLISGNPVRNSLKMIPRQEAREEWGLQDNKPVVLIFGGSLGARSLNEAVAEMAEELFNSFGTQILWQTGRFHFEAYSSAPVSRIPGVKIVPYIQNMGAAYSAADIIISRAGAITLAELSVAQKPTILVPYPYAAANHQEHNARTISQAGAALLVKEGDGFSFRLQQALISILQDRRKAAEMGQHWACLRRDDAAEVIAKKIIQIAEMSSNDSIR